MSDQQRSLFDTDPEPWEADDQAEQLVAGIVLATGPAQEFDYLVPDALRDLVEPGRRVLVPLGKGNRQVQGYCVRVESRLAGPRPLKPLAEVVDRRSLLSPAMLRLTRWIADYYLCPWGQVLETVLPAGVRGQAGTRMATLLTLDPRGAGTLSCVSASRGADEHGRLPDKHREILRALAAAAEPLTPQELARAAALLAGPHRHACAAKGSSARQTARVSSARQAEAALPREEHLRLNPDQQKALDAVLAALRSQQHRTLLIHGVTGSGKTEVYIQAIEEVVRYGRQAIVLVPEISLTPQTVERFRRRFGAVAVLHSHLSDADRYWHWQRIAEGRVPVVVGGAQRHLRPHAAAWADRSGRRARIDLQAGNRPALSRPRGGRGPGRGRERAADPRFRHAFLGKLESCPPGPVSIDRNAAAGLEPAAAGGGNDRSAGRRPARRAAAAASAACCTRRLPPHCKTTAR